MDTQRPSRQPWVRRHLVLVDSVVAAVALLATVVVVPRFGDNPQDPQPSTAVVVLTVLTLALVPLRHRWLVPTLVAGLAAASLVLMLVGPDSAASLAPGTAGAAGSSGDGRAPTPDLDRIDALVVSFTTAGLEVRWSMEGRPRPLPGAVDLVTYRVIEESLTNALKHGTGEARLSVAHAGSSLRLRVENPVRSLVPAGVGPAPAAGVGTGTGHGMLGMLERATAVGGTLTAGPSNDRFTVEAVLPLRESDLPVGQR